MAPMASKVGGQSCLVPRLTRAEKSMPNRFTKFSSTFSVLCAVSMDLLGASASRRPRGIAAIIPQGRPVGSRKSELAGETPALLGTVPRLRCSKCKFVWGNLFLLLLGGATLSAPAAALSPANLRCEYAVNPLGVDAPNPRLFWTVESRERGQKQTAYEILAASSLELLAKDNGDLWDSGKVSSDETIQIPYAAAVGIVAAGLLESPRLGYERKPVRLEPAGGVDDGHFETVRLEREMDCRLSQLGNGAVAP